MTLDHPHPREAGSAQEAQGALEASTATFGLLLTALGVALLADRLQIIDVNLGQLWPIILIMIGAGKLNSPADRWEGAWWIGIGSWWLVVTTTPITLRTTWPVMIIISGVLMIAESLARSATRPAPPESHDEVTPAIGSAGDDDGQ